MKDCTYIMDVIIKLFSVLLSAVALIMLPWLQYSMMVNEHTSSWLLFSTYFVHSGTVKQING